MQYFCVLISEYLHICVNFDILSCQSIYHAMQGRNLFLLLFLGCQKHIHLQLHPVEVVHEFRQALIRKLISLIVVFLKLGRDIRDRCRWPHLLLRKHLVATMV